ncbi:hypothetical protein GPJ61_10315 [Brevibacillus formosus]|uniref:Arm DNA-binding domain-containing protein n=1 Tax=Brevibacillus formosus TaxID=54913 RepID=UPI001C663C34|nr:hypothetical protein [Brevibacillus formosus]
MVGREVFLCSVAFKYSFITICVNVTRERITRRGFRTKKEAEKALVKAQAPK